MSGKLAGALFAFVCIILAILLLTEAITAAAAGIVFALVLLVLGLLSQGFRRH